MGSCSSKPKTAEFEGFTMQTLEETSQDEAAGKSVDVESVGLDCMEKQQISAESEQNDLINKETEIQNNSRAAYDFEEESAVKKKALEDVKLVVDKEITGVSAPGLTETTSMPFVEANYVNSVLHGSSESEPGTALSETASSVVPKNISKGPGAVHPQEKDVAVLNESAARPNARCKEEPKIVEFQESGFLEDTELQELQLHMILPEERRNDAAVLEPQEHRMPIIAHASSWEEMKVGTLGLNSQDKPDGQGNSLMELEPEDEAPHGNGVLRFVEDLEQKMSIEECMDCDIAAMGACMFSDSSGQSEKDILALRGSNNMSHQEAQGLALGATIAVHENGVLREPSNQQNEVGGSCSQPLNNGTCMFSYTEQSENDKILLLGKNQNVEGEGNSIVNDCEPSQNHASNGGLHNEWMQAKVVHRPGNIFSFAENLLHDESISRDLLPVNNDLQTDLHPGVVSDESWYILEKDDFKYCDPLLVVLKDPKQCAHQNNVNDVALEIQGTVGVLDDEAVDHRVYPKVQVAAKSKLRANCVPVWDPFEFGSHHKLVQEISAVDIDDVLEKLASEFERQESLAHSGS